MTTLFKNARILKMFDESIISGDVLIEGNLIKQIDRNIEGDFDEVIDCKGNLLMPGFKNAHTHSAMVFLRSIADDSNLQDWLFNEIFPREANLKEGCIRELTKIALLEYISGGVTGCIDQYFYIQEFEQTCLEFGFRAVNLAMYSASERPVELIKEIFDESKNNGGLVKYVIGMHSEYTADDDMFEKTQSLIEEINTPFYTHLGETYKEVKDCFDNRGMSPLQYFDSLGLFKNGGAIFHGVYLDDKDVELLKRFISSNGKIMPRRVTGTSAKYQRMLATAIKRARQMALLPYVAD